MSAALVVRKYRDHVARPEVAPSLQGHDVGSQLEVGDAPGGHVVGDTGRKILVVRETKASQARASVCPAGGTGINRHVCSVDRKEE